MSQVKQWGWVLLGLMAWPHVAQADDVMAQMAQVEVLTKATHSWNGSTLPSYAAGQPEISIVRVTLPEGAALPLHEHPYATAGVLLQGTITVRTPSGVAQQFTAGDGVIELVNQPHAGANTGTGDAVILVVYAGIEGQPVTHILAASSEEDAPL
jgi:quercetin dioxygenase-like cupin family protein